MMIKILIYLFIILLPLKISFSQSGWVSQFSGTTSNLHVIQFVNDQTGFCIGDGGVLLKTTNKGLNWNILSTGYNIDFKAMSFPSENTGYIVGDIGLIIKTTNGGDSWINLSFQPRILSSVFFVNNNTGYIGGKTSHGAPFPKLFKTLDGGISWDSIEVQVDHINTIFFINEPTGWISGPVLNGDIILKTNNGVWTLQYFTGRPDIIESIFFIDSLYGWIGSPAGITSLPTIYSTSNGGNSWIRSYEFSILSNINSIFFINRSEGWAVGDNNGILRTTNGGVNWIRQALKNSFIYRCVNFTNSLTGWVVGDSGIILKTTTGGVLTGFSNTSSELPDQYYLSQNYPNPFNPVTNLEFAIPNSVFVSIKIYDVLGNEIITLVNERKPPGSYEVKFDGINYPSGIYFYTLETDGNRTDTKRMMLLK